MGLLGAILDLPWAGPTQLWALPGQPPPDPHNCMRRWELGEEGVTETPRGRNASSLSHLRVCPPSLCPLIFHASHSPGGSEHTPGHPFLLGLELALKSPLCPSGGLGPAGEQGVGKPSGQDTGCHQPSLCLPEPGCPCSFLPPQRVLGEGRGATSLDATAGLLCDPIVLP